MSRVRVSGGPPLPPETAEAGASLALAETPALHCQPRATSPTPTAPPRSRSCGTTRQAGWEKLSSRDQQRTGEAAGATVWTTTDIAVAQKCQWLETTMDGPLSRGAGS